MHIPIRMPFRGAARVATDTASDATRLPLGRAATTASATAAPTPAATAAKLAPVPTPTPTPTPTPGNSGVGLFGMAAGGAGVLITGYSSFKNEFGKQTDGGSALGPSTYAIGGGAALLLMARTGGSFTQNAIRGAGALLVLGGIGGATAGAIERVRAPKVDPDDPAIRNQTPSTFASGAPAAAADLAGIELAIASVKTIDKGTRGDRDVSVYIDPSTSVVVPRESGLEQAIAQARALSQGDVQNRSHAVVQTKDGSYAIARLVGDLDQVDGRNYATDNTFDREFEPHIDKLQPSLQAIVGVERNYDLRADAPVNSSGTEPLGDIPWVTPQLPPAMTTTTSTPKPVGN